MIPEKSKELLNRPKKNSNQLEGSSYKIELSDFCEIKEKIRLVYFLKNIQYENHDLAIARSSSSRADPGHRVAFKCLNV